MKGGEYMVKKRIRPVIKEEKIVESVEEAKPVVEVKSKVTFLGPGSVSGEYRFKELAGTVSAGSIEEATAKAEEIITKHPALRVA